LPFSPHARSCSSLAGTFEMISFVQAPQHGGEAESGDGRARGGQERTSVHAGLLADRIESFPRLGQRRAQVGAHHRSSAAKL
jgi:hypothetical protein